MFGNYHCTRKHLTAANSFGLGRCMKQLPGWALSATAFAGHSQLAHPTLVCREENYVGPGVLYRRVQEPKGRKC